MADNSSVWEDDPHLEKHGRSWLEYLALTTDYLSIPLCFLAVLADYSLIYTVLRYRRLKNRTNYYLLNFAVFHLVYIISTPLFYLILDIFYKDGMEINWYCTWSRVENFGMALLLTFIAGYGVDVLIEDHKPTWFSKYRERYFYLFSFFYFLHFMIYLISASICFKEAFRNNFNFYFLTIYYLLEVIFLLYLGISDKYEKSNALTISITILLIWLPLFFVYNLLNFVKDTNVEFFLWYSAFLPEYLAYSSPIIVSCQLWKYNKHFKTAFRKLFKRHVSFPDYEELFMNETKIDDDDKM
ncbi:uncharacterized protein LOC130449581 [Diorhabda sublineata]|uniref:uncharacterized protein LOC130449581 n=1 Tax=Diorhabda sublineata TaxID=1163346 RepID=UPI0024E086FD|nr:uncharacterized protein LOC130449581 [Diorhabda sublineata]